MKTKEIYVRNNKRPTIYIENIVLISSKIDWDEKHLATTRYFSPYRHYNLPYHYVLVDFSMFQAIDVKQLMYHF